MSADDTGPASVGAAHRPLREIVTDAIRQAIWDGRFPPGMHLVEDRLAAEFGVSRNPVREAIRALAADGLITVLPRRGAIVAELSLDEAGEMVEVRATLEGLNARLAARRRDPAILARLRDILDGGTAALAKGKVERLPELNAEFHDALANAGSNRVLGDLMRTLRDRTRRFFRTTSLAAAKRTWEEHAQILEAVIAGDEELACLLATRHVSRAGQQAEAAAPAARARAS